MCLVTGLVGQSLFEEPGGVRVILPVQGKSEYTIRAYIIGGTIRELNKVKAPDDDDDEPSTLPLACATPWTKRINEAAGSIVLCV